MPYKEAFWEGSFVGALSKADQRPKPRRSDHKSDEPLGSSTNVRAAIFQSRVNILGAILSLFFNRNPGQ